MAKRKVIKKPAFDKGGTVFLKATLGKGSVYEIVKVDRIGEEEEQIFYRLQVGEAQDGKPQVTENLFAEQELCLKEEAQEILKQREAGIKEAG